MKARPAKEEKMSASPMGDVNMIPLGQRPPKAEEKKEPELEPIPDVEWWDARILLDPKVCPVLCRRYYSCRQQECVVHVSSALTNGHAVRGALLEHNTAHDLPHWHFTANPNISAVVHDQSIRLFRMSFAAVQ